MLLQLIIDGAGRYVVNWCSRFESRKIVLLRSLFSKRKNGDHSDYSLFMHNFDTSEASTWRSVLKNLYMHA